MVYINLTRATIVNRLKKASDRQSTAKSKGRLSPKEVAVALNRANIESPRDLCEALVGEGILFRHSPNRFIPRASVFEGGRILIKRTELEMERGILIPGHRFLPLYDHQLLPKDIEIKVMGKKVKRTPIAISLDDLTIYYSLFGSQNYLPLVASESELNVQVMSSGNTPKNLVVTVSAFDMSAIDDELSLRPGDYLIAQLTDWRKGQFILYPEESAQSKQRTTKWVETLDKGFDTLLSEIPWPLPPDEELARAFFLAGRQVVDKPALHVGGYLEMSSRIGIVSEDESTYLWDARREMNTKERALAGSVEPGLSDSLFEELCIRHRIPIPMAYVKACVQRFLEEIERLSFSHLLNDVFVGLNMEVLSDEDWFQLTDALETYIDDMSTFESSDDKTYRRLRDQFILLYKGIMRWIAHNEMHFARFDAVDDNLLRELMETAMKSVDALNMLNSVVSVRPEHAQALEEMHRKLSAEFNRNATLIYEQLKKGERSYRREMRVKSASAVEYIVLDVELEELDPPVFRRLRVPGTMNLRDLHEVLQVSFSWEDRHLHAFYVADVEYTDLDTWEPDFADSPKPQDDQLLMVEDLADLCNELLYVYDFGDDWRHHIAIHEVIPAGDVPEEEKESVVCLDGYGAGPPEDCGGLPGYEALVEAIKTPEHRRDDEQNNTIIWAGEWSPDAFSLQEINTLLKNL